MMGDRGVHTLDVAVWALKLGHPTSIEATSCGNNAEIHPVADMVTFRFPARDNLPPVKLTWYEGLRAPWPEGLDKDLEMPREGGIVIKGSKGSIMANVYAGEPRLLPKQLHKDYKRPAKTLPRIPDESHEMDWVRAAKGGFKACSNFEYASHLTEICLLGNVAQRADAPLEWDGAAMKFTNQPEANQYLKTEYRKGWSL
jgi:hypothetical protein